MLVGSSGVKDLVAVNGAVLLVCYHALIGVGGHDGFETRGEPSRTLGCSHRRVVVLSSGMGRRQGDGDGDSSLDGARWCGGSDSEDLGWSYHRVMD
jgi:hypothetical protein